MNQKEHRHKILLFFFFFKELSFILDNDTA